MRIPWIFFPSALLLAQSALAIPIISGDGTETCLEGPALGSGGACDVIAITPAGVWQPNDPRARGAVWVSYDDTGRPGTVTAMPGLVATFSETFFASAGDTLDLEVWADNFVDVLIDGTVVFAASSPEMFYPNTQAVIQHVFQDMGQHTVSFDVYQGGGPEPPPGNPFGLLYTGTATVTPVPEPSTLALMAIGLAGVGFAGRRKLAA